MTETATCGICGEPMPPGEEMFNYHGYSGPCPKPPKRTLEQGGPEDRILAIMRRYRKDRLQWIKDGMPQDELPDELSQEAEAGAIVAAFLVHG